jgi:hypothetical protein
MKLKYDPDYDHRPGYQRDFLAGHDVPPPMAPDDEALKARLAEVLQSIRKN